MSFKTEYSSKTDWLCGYDMENVLFCFPCLLFGGEDHWTKIGISDINHLSDHVNNINLQTYT